MIASPLPSPPPALSDTEPPFTPFRPDPAKLDQLLQDLISPYASLHDVARNNNTTLAALTIWMAMAENQALLDQVESAGYRRARLAASNVLVHAVNSLSFALTGHVEVESKYLTRLDERAIKLYERSRSNARKAAWLLYRISRSHPSIPIDPATRVKLEELRIERAELNASRGSALGGTTLQSGVSSGSALGGTAGGLQSGLQERVPSLPSEPTPIVDRQAASRLAESTETAWGRVPSVPSEPASEAGEEELMPVAHQTSTTPTDISSPSTEPLPTTDPAPSTNPFPASNSTLQSTIPLTQFPRACASPCTSCASSRHTSQRLHPPPNSS